MIIELCQRRVFLLASSVPEGDLDGLAADAEFLLVIAGTQSGLVGRVRELVVDKPAAKVSADGYLCAIDDLPTPESPRSTSLNMK